MATADDRREWKRIVAAGKKPPKPEPPPICEGCGRKLGPSKKCGCHQTVKYLPTPEEIAEKCKQYQATKDAERERLAGLNPYTVPTIACGSIPKPRARRD